MICGAWGTRKGKLQTLYLCVKKTVHRALKDKPRIRPNLTYKGGD